MPGKPKAMAVKVARLEQRALDVAFELLEAAPEQYRNDPPRKCAKDDPTYLTWQEALATVSQAALALEELGNVLRAKGGIKDRSPMTQRFIEDLGKQPDVIAELERLEATGVESREIRLRLEPGKDRSAWSEIDYHGRDLQAWKYPDPVRA